jgi:hypothetical protein
MNVALGEACQGGSGASNGGAGVTLTFVNTKSYRELRHTSNFHYHDSTAIDAARRHLHTPYSP